MDLRSFGASCNAAGPNIMGDGGYQQSYLEMVELMEKQDLIFTAEYAECPLCFSILPEGKGVVLRECLHIFCRQCLVDCIQYTDMTPVKCPYPDYLNCPCSSFIQEREIKAIVPSEIFKRYLDRSLRLAETQSSNSFHCKTVGCTAWCVVEENAKIFHCPVCNKQNLIEKDDKEEDGKSFFSFLEKADSNQALLSSFAAAECPICYTFIDKGEGVMLKECLHVFCTKCLVDSIQYTDMTPVKCPYPDHLGLPCGNFIQEREIKAIVPPEIYKQYLDRSLKLAEKQSSDSFHCKTVGCTAWCVVEENARIFYCPVCKKQNFIEEGDNEDVKAFLSVLELADNQDLLSSTTDADCPICFTFMAKGEGVMLKECLHIFCRDCLAHCVQYGDESAATVSCPYRADDDYVCQCQIQEREIKALVSREIFEKYLARSVNLAEHHSVNSFHCKTPDCTAWTVYDDDVNVFDCPVCKKQNCITCAGIHEGMDCLKYQSYLAINAEKDGDAKKSLEMLKNMIEEGKALHCPQCQIILIKMGGCDWLACTCCKTEICWATKGFRWGKNGKGDTSGGCKCRVNGQLCHPKCGNCH